MAKIKIRNSGNRSNGGRPRAEGDRYPSGKLRPHKPNARTLEMRAAFGVTDIGQAFTPIQIAGRQGWLSAEDCRTAALFASIHGLAGLGRSASAVGAVLEVAEGTDVTGDPGAASLFATLPHSEIAAIWDAVFNTTSNSVDHEVRAHKAMQQWKAANAAMTASQRNEVYDVCILDSFPQWIIQRCAGRMETTWERKRDLLIVGLRAIAKSLQPDTQTAGHTEPHEHSGQSADRPSSARRQLYVDQDGQPLFEVERLYRLRPAA